MKKRMQKIISLLLVTSFTFGINATGLTGKMTSQTVIPEAELDSSEKFYEGFDIDAFTDAESSAGVMAVDGEGETTVPDSESYDVYALLEFDYPDLDLSTLEGLDVEARRDAVRDYYKPRNEQIVAQLGLEGVTVSYSAPFADISFDSVTEYQTEREGLITASDNLSIDFVGVDLIETVESDPTIEFNGSDYSLSKIIDDLGIGDNTYDGEGIKAGILEPYFPDENHALLSESDFEFYGNTEVLNHTTNVAILINAIAPGCSFYSAAYNDNCTITACLNWLIYEKYVDIINMSATMEVIAGDVETNEGSTVYTRLTAYIDYLIGASSCLIVKSAGNRGLEDAEITKPGMAINMLTVGSYTYYGGSRENIVSSFSSYEEDVASIFKPEVVAPGARVNNDGMGQVNGTSFAAPIVTGIAVRLLHEYPNTKVDVCLLKAAIMSGCERLSLTHSYIDDKAGMGEVNYARSRDVLANYNYGTAYKYSSDTAGTLIYEDAFIVEPSDTVKITLNRVIVGQNGDLTLEEISPDMTSYLVDVTFEVDGWEYPMAGCNWTQSIQYASYTNIYNHNLNCKIKIYVSDSNTNELEEMIAVAYNGATHQHTYSSSHYVKNNAQHYSYCNCGLYILETHEFLDNGTTPRRCKWCSYPEGYLPY